MARKKSDDAEEEFVIGAPSKDAPGNVERYEVRIGPPILGGGRKATPVREAEPGAPSGAAVPRPQSAAAQRAPGPAYGVAGTQQMFKLEDDLRRTREVVEDLRHTSSILEGDVRDLKGEMERISYLLKSLEGLRNSLKDIESTVSELSGLYDLISANINPFIDIPPMKAREGPKGAQSVKRVDAAFNDVREVFEADDECPTAQGDQLASEEYIMRWTKFLIEKVGKEGLERTLDYYLEMNWIDESIMDRVFNMARGLSSPPRGEEGKRTTWRLDAEDHIQSLDYIKRIKGDRR